MDDAPDMSGNNDSDDTVAEEVPVEDTVPPVSQVIEAMPVDETPQQQQPDASLGSKKRVGVKKDSGGVRKSRRAVKRNAVVLVKKPRLSDQTEKRKKRRLKPATVIARAIKKLQNGTEFLLRKAPLERLMREILADEKPDARITAHAVVALQMAVEDLGVNVFQTAQLVTNTTEHELLMQPEFRLSAKIHKLLPPEVTEQDFANVKRNRAHRYAEIQRLKQIRREARESDK